jgi:lipoic acid synthetase
MAQAFPEWIRRPWASGQEFEFTKDLIGDLDLHTVCQSANCPNMSDCWQRRTATMMVLGNACTRSCRYCSVPAGAPESVEADEPSRVAEAVRRMKLGHTVITSVTRDDLPDGGAGHIAATIEAIHMANPETTLETLVPDFQAVAQDIETVLEARPEVFSHNIETVRRLYPVIRSNRFDYDMALDVLRIARDSGLPSIRKSALMVGHGETVDEVKETLEDLLGAGCESVSIGQYLRPTKKQREVADYIHPDQFAAYEALALEMGFGFAVAGPFVRSSYRSEELLEAPFARARVDEMRRAMA